MRKIGRAVNRILGGPGSGKGTQCELLLQEVNAEKPDAGPKTGASSSSLKLPSKLYHVNVGGLLRAELKRYNDQLASKSSIVTPFGKIISEQLSTGQILPSWVTISLMRQELERITLIEGIDSAVTTSAIMIDGFPRSVENFEEFERQILPASRLIVLECDEQALVERVRTRAAREGRQDDQDINAVKNRLAVFRSETQDVIKNFQPLDIDKTPYKFAYRNVVKIDGSRSIEEVAKDFQKAFAMLLQAPTIQTSSAPHPHRSVTIDD